MSIITVLMVVHNGATHISEAINSVLAQSWSDFELLIIDDASTDHTVEIIKKIQDPRIRLIQNEKGYITNLNIGLSEAKGKYIARFDSDDFMHSDRLLVQLKRMYNNNIDLLSCWGATINEDLAFTPIYCEGIYREIHFPKLQLLKSNFIIHSGTMLKKSFLFENDLKYLDTYQYCEDYFLWYNMAKAGARFYIEPQVLVGLRQHNNQISQLYKNDMALNSQFLRRDIIIDLLVENNAPELIETAKNLFNFYRYNELDMENYFDYFYSISSLCNAKNLKGTNGLSLITNT